MRALDGIKHSASQAGTWWRAASAWRRAAAVLLVVAALAVAGFVLLVSAANVRCGDALGKLSDRQQATCARIGARPRYCNGCG